MITFLLIATLATTTHSLEAKRKPDQTGAQISRLLADTTAGCAPFQTPEELNESYYESYAWRFEQYDTDPCHPTFRSLFAAHAPFAPGGSAKNIIDIGAGPGHAAKWMESEGHHVECIVHHRWFKHYCRKKALPATLSSLREFRPTKKYDIAVGLCWPFNHIRPEWAPQQIARISTEFLKPGGLFIAAVFMGSGIAYQDPMKMGHKRYFVHYTQEQWLSMIRPYFEVVSSHEHFLDAIKKDVRIFVMKNKTTG